MVEWLIPLPIQLRLLSLFPSFLFYPLPPPFIHLLSRRYFRYSYFYAALSPSLFLHIPRPPTGLQPKLTFTLSNVSSRNDTARINKQTNLAKQVNLSKTYMDLGYRLLAVVVRSLP